MRGMRETRANTSNTDQKQEAQIREARDVSWKTQTVPSPIKIVKSLQKSSSLTVSQEALYEKVTRGRVVDIQKVNKK